MKQLLHFIKTSEFKLVGRKFPLREIYLLLFYNGTCGLDMDEIALYPSVDNDQQTRLNADRDTLMDELLNSRRIYSFLSFDLKTGT